MITQSKLLFIFVFVFLLSACKKDEDDSKNITDLVTFEVISPKEGQVFESDDTIILTAAAYAPFEIHGFTIKFKAISNDSFVSHFYQHTHGKQITINQFKPVSTLAAKEKYKVIFILHVDHSNNELVEEREISVW